MPFLLMVSLIWAFSFGLIKGGLTGLPSPTIAWIRLMIALVVFIPFLRPRALCLSDTARLLVTGAVQYGLMYVAYLHAFERLKAYEVALFTVFTPIYVTFIHDLFERRIHRASLVAGTLAVVGGGVIEFRQLSSPELWHGFLLMQGSNLCFAFGQIFYGRIMAGRPGKRTDLQVFGLLYLGAVLGVSFTASRPAWEALTTISARQAALLFYLGVVASGLGFFLWNIGARRVSTSTLAVFNNLKIPLAILISVLFFGESVNWLRLLSGGALIVLALTVNPARRV